MATIPNDEQLNRRYGPMRCRVDPLVHGTVRARRTGGEEWLGLHLWVSRDARPDRERIAHGGLRRIDLVTAFLSERELHFRIQPVRPAYIFTYTRLPARQIVPVTVVTKNANAIPIFLFVC